MAYSGRCLLSGYMNKRDPNQITCTNACRLEYKTEAAKEDENGQIVEANPTGVAIQVKLRVLKFRTSARQHTRPW